GRGTRLFASLAADREVQEGAIDVAELFGLGEKRHVPAKQLPQGGKKLLDVASAFALRPELILLDEPTSGGSTADKTTIMASLVGRNGAGKTTTLRTIMGYLRPHAGRVEFRGQPIHGRRTHEIAQLGVGWAPEDSGIFADLTVAENIEIATWTRSGGRPAAERIALAYRVFPMLRRYAARKGPELSGGERKMLSIARALALDPEMLLLDEPFEGLSPAIIPAVGSGIAAITRLGHAILIAESNIHHVPD